MTVSVIVATCNRVQELEKLLESILAQTSLPDEVIIVDQSDDQKTKELVSGFKNKTDKNGIDFIWHHQAEKSLVKARNKGFSLSKGDIIAYLDDDAFLEKDYFKWIISYFERYPKIGGFTGNLKIAHPVSGWKWPIRKILLKIFLIDSLDGKMTSSGFGYPIFRKEIEKLTYVELMSGYSMNFRRCVMEPFDEFFTGYGFREDVEFTYRISRKTPLAAVPEARFEHNPSLKNRDGVLPLQKMALRNYRYIFEKYKAKNLFSNILFAYSVSGIFFIDLLEWLSGFKQNKKERLIGDIEALKSLVGERTLFLNRNRELKND